MNDYILYIEDNYPLKENFKYIDKKFEQARTYLSFAHENYYIYFEIGNREYISIMYIERNILKDNDGNVYENYYTCDL